MVLIGGINITEHKPALKMGGFLSINVDVKSNPFCVSMRELNTICKSCYAYYMETRYPRLARALEKNSSVLSEVALLDYSAIAEYIVNHSIGLRFNSIGEIININHVRHMNKISYHVHKLNPDFPITLWTKRKSYARYISADITLIYSNPYVDSPMREVPYNFNGVFNVNTHNYFSRTHTKPNCIGKCRECMKCYTYPTGGLVINELIKRDQTAIKHGKLVPL